MLDLDGNATLGRTEFQEVNIPYYVFRHLFHAVSLSASVGGRIYPFSTLKNDCGSRRKTKP
jgi:hypothetical protein